MMDAFRDFAAGNFAGGIGRLEQNPDWTDGQNDPTRPYYLGFPGNMPGWGEGVLLASLLKRLAVPGNRTFDVFADPALCSLLSEDPSFNATAAADFATARGQNARSPLAILRAALTGDLLTRPFHPIQIDDAPRRKKIGIAWASVMRNGNHLQAKSLPLNNMLQSVGSMANTDILSFQRQTSAAEQAQLPALSAINQVPDAELNANDQLAVARHIKPLDAMLTISTTTAHIAAAMGKPTFVVAARRNGPQWFWQAQGDHALALYPTARVFLGDLQQNADWWPAPLQQATAELNQV